jgi:hypothetical protein
MIKQSKDLKDFKMDKLKGTWIGYLDESQSTHDFTCIAQRIVPISQLNGLSIY